MMLMSILKALPRELSVFLISLLIATVIILLSHSALESSEENRKSQFATLQNTKARYHKAVEHKRIVEEFSTRYNDLLDKGRVGDDNRLNWIDAVEKTTTKYKIPYVKYRIDQRQQLKDNALKQNFPDIDVFSSSMHLEMQLLHEGDLYRLLNHLHSTARGIFSVEKCAIRKNKMQQASIVESATDKNFAAVCTLNWFSLLPRANKPAVMGRKS